MRNIKIIDFSGVPLSPETVSEKAGFEIIDAHIEEGYRHFILDMSNIEFSDPEGFQRVGMMLMASWSSIMGINGKSIIVKPQGMMSVFGSVLEGMFSGTDWILVDSIAEGRGAIG